MEDAMVLEAGGPVDAAAEIEEEEMVCWYLTRVKNNRYSLTTEF